MIRQWLVYIKLSLLRDAGATMLDDEPDQARLLAAYDIFKCDPHRAFEEMRALAELGSTNAAINIGWAYHHGKGVAKDLSQAEFWLKQAFEKGDPAASYYLGNLYSTLGKIDEANLIYKNGVELGYFPAAYCLAINIINKGENREEITYGYELLKWAARFGHAYSIRKLAELYIHGKFGLFKIPYGFYLFFKSAWIALTVALKNETDDRLHS